MLLLSGVVVGSFFIALMSSIMVLSDSAATRNAFLWLLGGFGSSSWQSLAVFTVYAVFPLLLALNARGLDLLALGEEPAQHLGADVERTMRMVYVCTALLTAASVAACGIIGFVGSGRSPRRPHGRAPDPSHPAAARLSRRRLLSRPLRHRLASGRAAARAAGRRHHRARRRSDLRRAAPENAHMIVEAREVTARYGRRATRAAGRELPVEERRMVAAVGPNGSGKTTLVRALSGLLPLEGGTVLVNGRARRSVAPARARANASGVLPQREEILFPLRVDETVMLGRYAHLGPLAASREADRAAVEAALERCDVAAFAGPIGGLALGRGVAAGASGAGTRPAAARPDARRADCLARRASRDGALRALSNAGG